MVKKGVLIAVAMLLAAGMAAGYFFGRPLWVPVYQRTVGKTTVSAAVQTHGEAARRRMRPYFDAAGVAYPPQKVTLLGLKDSARLELWAETVMGPVLIRVYPIRALSGSAGPKLREGDRQVPEGLYQIEGVNPNSLYHLSLKLNYPNDFDRYHANIERRANPGSNIFIHGKAVSVGCLAMGDEVIEELFVLTWDIGKSNIQVAIAPTDPRGKKLSTAIKPAWVAELYGRLNDFFGRYRQTESWQGVRHEFFKKVVRTQTEER